MNDWRADGNAANVYAQLEQLPPHSNPNKEPNMSQFPTANDISQSKYMKKEDVGEDGCTCTIASFEKANVGKEDEPEYKWTMRVTGTDLEGKPLKPLVLNATNWAAIERAYGKDASQWLGKKIFVYNDPNVSFGKQFTGGIRVRVQRTDMRSGTLAKAQMPHGNTRSEDDINRDLADDPPF